MALVETMKFGGVKINVFDDHINEKYEIDLKNDTAYFKNALRKKAEKVKNKWR